MTSVDIHVFDAVRAYLLRHYHDKKFIVYGRSNAILHNIYKLFIRCVIIPFDDMIRTMPDESRIKQWVIDTINSMLINEYDVAVGVGNGLRFMEMFIDYNKNNPRNSINDQLIHDIINSVSIILANMRYRSAFSDDGCDNMMRKFYNYVSITTIGMIAGGICYSLVLYMGFINK
ncbi:ankyrin-like protein [Skunkpox virus]|uniref:Ankyrin-like protein n=1 Tax=Skunkpox virus TaxID=160796 RepID=A0A1C9KBX6_9POXV|nr:ankyrin-like protein [Skunkpox virus]AOP31662.1 ankyrin-like protein [Skunkpox virus]